MNRLQEIKKLAGQIQQSDDKIIIAASVARIEQLAQEEIDNRLVSKSTLTDTIDICNDLLGQIE